MTIRRMALKSSADLAAGQPGRASFHSCLLVRKLEMVKTQLAQAEIYVHEEGDIDGFIGLHGAYIAGLFVAESESARASARSCLHMSCVLRTALAEGI